MADASTPKIELPLKPSVETLQQQIDSMKEAVKLLQNFADRTPTTSDVQWQVAGLKELTKVQIDAAETLNKALNEQRDRYELRIADIISAQKDTDARLLSQTVDKLTVSTEGRLSLLEKNQYLVGGQASVRDPATAEAMALMTRAISTLSTAGSKGEGRETGRGDFIGWIVAGVAVIGGLIAIFAKFGT